ncbi:FAD-dependent oxidoreductase [Nocardioides sp.]|uniref:FAD-dependent oxidoreductase n=1 Tax=Nocardioides sp. TaxID=35761 RepID=UPI002CDD555D|nr:FAD-dependent oxidoreductase [Nocardioides sp.]HXH77641.1 FAD-dependent oxidoreductase [Nocardioides sp.]
MRVHVLGAGIIGLACARELIRRGHDVTVVDPAPGSGASHAAAGMLSPAGEAWHGESALHALGVASARLWPSYAATLGVPLQHTGTLLVGVDAGDRQMVERQVALLAGHGVEVEVLDGRGARLLEPALARVGAAAVLSQDGAVDPRAVVAALVTELGPRVVASGPSTLPDATVLATGARLPAPYDRLVRGVRGEILRLRGEIGLSRVLRGWVRGEPVYVVPRPGGEVVVGATSEEHDGPPVVTAGGVRRLLAAATELVPGLDRAELREALARDRPGTADNRPLVGPTCEAGVFLAAGHFRHGVLLAPLTASLVADAVEGADPDPTLDPRRFDVQTNQEDA